MTELERLLQAADKIAASIRTKKLERSKRGELFNAFTLCGVNHYELWHSKIIAALLNPKEQHGQGTLFLKLFLEILHLRFDPYFDYASAEVFTEYDIKEYGRLDIYIYDHCRHHIIIENKVYSPEREDQLKKYQKYADSLDGDTKIIFLTLDRRESQTADNDYYERISYREHIVNWLDRCIEVSSRMPAIREMLIQYQNLIKKLTNTDMDAEDKNKLIEMMFRHCEGVSYIWNYSNEFVNKALSDYLILQMSEECLKRNIVLKVPEGFRLPAKPNERIVLVPDQWKRLQIVLQAERKDLMWLFIGVCSQDSAKCDEVESFNCLEGGNNNWPGGWKYLEPCDLNPMAVPEIVSGDYVKKIMGIVDDIIKEGDGREMSL